jgi:hypothetical protein
MGLLTCLQPVFREPLLILRILSQDLILVGLLTAMLAATTAGIVHHRAEMGSLTWMRNSECGMELIPRSEFRIPHFRDGSSSTMNGSS